MKNSPQDHWSAHVGCLCIVLKGEELSLEEWGVSAQAPSLAFGSDPTNKVNLRIFSLEGVSCSEWVAGCRSRRAQGVSLRTSLCRVYRVLECFLLSQQFSILCTIQVSNRSVTFCKSLIIKEVLRLHPYAGKKNRFPRLFAKKQELISRNKFLGAHSVSDKLKELSRAVIYQVKA